MNTRKDFWRAVEIITEYKTKFGPGAATTGMTEAFVEFFRQDNPRFDEERFRQAVEEF